MNTFFDIEEDGRVEMPQWNELLIKVEKIESKYDGSLRNSVSNSEIIKMKQTIQQKLGNIIIPESYIEFLQNVNGLDFNGLVIYGVDEILLDNEADEEVQGFIETNELWYENDWQKKYIFFGNSDTAWYCYDLNKRVYVELDKPSGTLIQFFDSFDSMLSDALEASLL
ncbi:YrhA family protein [Peribacillus frigoritolerans]|uniref:YrhA family protein n=1 Tax=Peribacillus frigoritolerans TaxID=450367 RepID=UPI003D27F8FA